MANTSGIRAGRAFVEIGTDLSGLEKGLAKAEARLTAFADAVHRMGRGLAAGGLAIVGPLLAAVKVTASLGEELYQLSRRSGIPIEDLQALRYAAEQADVKAEDLEVALKRMQRMIVAAAQGNKAAVRTFANLGLTWHDLARLNPAAQYRRLADAMQQIPDATLRAATAFALFGRSGTNLLPMLLLGSKGIADLEKQAHAYGLVISEEAVVATRDLDRQLELLWEAARRVTFEVGAALNDSLTRLANAAVSAVPALSGLVAEHKQLIVYSAAVGVALTAIGSGLMGLGLLVRSFAVETGLLAGGLRGLGTLLGGLGKGLSRSLAGLAGLAAGILPALAALGTAGDAAMMGLAAGGKAAYAGLAHLVGLLPLLGQGLYTAGRAALFFARPLNALYLDGYLITRSILGLIPVFDGLLVLLKGLPRALAAAGTALGAAVAHPVASLTGLLATLKAGLASLGTAFAASGSAAAILGAALASLAAVAAATIVALARQKALADELAKGTGHDTARSARTALAGEQAAAEAMIRRLAELADQQRLSDTQTAEASRLIAALTARYGDLGLALDGVTGRLGGVAEAMAAIHRENSRHLKVSLDREIEAAGRRLEQLRGRMSRSGGAEGFSFWDYNKVEFTEAQGQYDQTAAQLREALGKRRKLAALPAGAATEVERWDFAAEEKFQDWFAQLKKFVEDTGQKFEAGPDDLRYDFRKMFLHGGWAQKTEYGDYRMPDLGNLPGRPVTPEERANLAPTFSVQGLGETHEFQQRLAERERAEKELAETTTRLGRLEDEAAMERMSTIQREIFLIRRRAKERAEDLLKAEAYRQASRPLWGGPGLGQAVSAAGTLGAVAAAGGAIQQGEAHAADARREYDAKEQEKAARQAAEQALIGLEVERDIAQMRHQQLQDQQALGGKLQKQELEQAARAAARAEDKAAAASYRQQMAERVRRAYPLAENATPQQIDENEEAIYRVMQQVEAAALAIERTHEADRQVQSATVAGTFSKTALEGLGGGSVLDRIASATEKTARHTETMKDKLGPQTFR